MVYNIYFSPTGGTEKVSRILTGAISEKYEKLDLIKKDGFDRSFSKDDLCVISVPAFGGRIPENAAKKIKMLRAEGTAAVLTAVFGNRAIDDTMTELYDLAESAGFNVIAGVEAVAEHSLVRSFGAGRPNRYDVEELSSFASRIIEKLQKGDLSVPRLPGNRPYKEFRPSAMKPLVDDSCINCGKCSKECPVEAISADNVRIIDGAKCFSCMHCVAVCPKNARHNAPEVTEALEARLRDRCAEAKPNKLYI